MKSIPLDLLKLDGKDHGDFKFKFHPEGVELLIQKPQCDKNTYYLSISELFLLKDDIGKVLAKSDYVDVMNRINKATPEDEGFLP